MTKKHFQLIADALKAATPLASEGPVAMRTWENTVYKVADALRATNPNYKREKFVNACMGE